MKRGLQSTSLHVQSLLDTVLVWQGKLIAYIYSVVCFYNTETLNRLGEVCSRGRVTFQSGSIGQAKGCCGNLHLPSVHLEPSAFKEGKVV